MNRPFRFIWHVACVVLMCACGALGQTPTPRPEPGPPSQFQQHLDRLGVNLRVPQRGRAIVINIPAFELIAFEDGEPVLQSRVIVGTPWTPTPVMTTYTSAVRFRPTWRPTRSMVASGEYPDRIWPPGPNNPLGLAAIRLQPNLLIYLHDTNRREKFLAEDRALSHGCVRVQNWDGLIAWLLRIELDAVHRMANGTKTFDVRTPAIPVIFGYFTLFPKVDGTPQTFDDIYGRSEAPSASFPVCAL